MATANIFNESSFEISIDSTSIESSFIQICHDHNLQSGWINIIFLSEENHIDLNFKHLHHNYATDVITFSFNESEVISGEIYINPFMAERNALEYGQTTLQEIKRLIIHGLLHLVGYDDKTDNERLEMHNLENEYLKGFM